MAKYLLSVHMVDGEAPPSEDQMQQMFADVGAFNTAAQEAGVWVYGLDGEATASIHGTDLRGNVALVLGGEGEGMRRLTREHCDALIKIPMPGEMESLNVSVATGVALFEVVRQRFGSVK